MPRRMFVYGYGSLINRGSLTHTLDAEGLGEIVTGRVQGFQRAWSNRSTVRRRTGLGVRRHASACVNGVAIEVSAEQLQALDIRETGYERVVVEAQDLVDGTLWIYTKPNGERPTEECPIALSYVDCVLAGCLEKGKAFAVEFMRTTGWWTTPLMNDRAKPQYPRRTPMTTATVAQIDALLAEHLENHIP